MLIAAAAGYSSSPSWPGLKRNANASVRFATAPTGCAS